MRSTPLVGTCLLFAALATAGCQPYHVHVDCRLTPDRSLWPRLNGPLYVIHGPTPEIESTLQFQDYADMLNRALREVRPGLRRVAIGQTANLDVTMAYAVRYRGQAIETYPSFQPVYGFGPFGEGLFDTYVGTEVTTVDLGYRHMLNLSAWIADRGQPAGRKVLWEARADVTSDERDLRQTMPAMLLGATSLYGQSTAGIVTIKYSRNDKRFKVLEQPSLYVSEPTTSGPSKQ